jgi:hypothetical protein
MSGEKWAERYPEEESYSVGAVLWHGSVTSRLEFGIHYLHQEQSSAVSNTDDPARFSYPGLL